MIPKAKSRQQLAREYGVHIKTFMNWLKREGITIEPGVLYPKKVEEIYEKLGKPKVGSTD